MPEEARSRRHDTTPDRRDRASPPLIRRAAPCDERVRGLRRPGGSAHALHEPRTSCGACARGSAPGSYGTVRSVPEKQTFEQGGRLALIFAVIGAVLTAALLGGLLAICSHSSIGLIALLLSALTGGFILLFLVGALALGIATVRKATKRWQPVTAIVLALVFVPGAVALVNPLHVILAEDGSFCGEPPPADARRVQGELRTPSEAGSRRGSDPSRRR